MILLFTIIIYRIPTELEVIYLGFAYWIISIILTKEGWPKQHFIYKADTKKNKVISNKKKKYSFGLLSVLSTFTY